MHRPRINIMIMTQGEPTAPVRSYSFPWYAPRMAVIAGVTTLILLLTTTILFLYFYIESREIAGLRSQLQAANASLGKVDALEEELVYHRDFTRRVAGLVEISVPDFADSVRTDLSGSSAVASAGLDSLRIEGEGDDGNIWGVGVLVTACPPDPNNRPRGMPLSGSVSRGFLPLQNNPSLRHSGIDLAAREGIPVLATANGTVEFAGEDETFGFLITIDHGNGFKTTYGHNSLLLMNEGEKVQRGDRIALSGNTGVSSAPHLHYEITENGVPVDPAGFLGR